MITNAMISAIAALVLSMSSAWAGPMDIYMGKARPVVVFAAKNSPAFREQIAVLQAAMDGVRTREIVLIGVEGRSASAIIGGPAPRVRGDILRHTFDVKPDEFKVLLIGKDGGVKFKSAKVVSAEDIFMLVEGMPMRQQEMRR